MLDFERICRLCLAERNRMRHVTEYQSEFFKNIFGTILQIEIIPGDELPQQICWNCISTLTKVNNTVQEFRTNELKLRNQLVQTIQVKPEIIEEDFQEAEPITFVKCESVQETLEIERLEEVDSEATLEADPNDQKDVESPQYEQHERQTAKKASELVKINLAKNSNRPVQVDVSEIIIPKGKPGRPRVRPIVERRKGVFGRKPKFPKDPNQPVLRKNAKLCYICMSEPFETAEALYFHLNSHNDLLPYTCSICVKETVEIKQVTTLNIHKRMHLLPVPCSHCDKRFISNNSLRLHLIMQHQDLEADSAAPKPCPTCGKEFLSEKALKFHMHSHNQKTNCEICGKMYYSKTKLKLHIQRVHENAGKVECQVCHKMLKTLDALQSHMKVMHSEAKLQCKYCPKTYTSKGSLQCHEKRHETIPEWKEFSNEWKQYYTYVDGENGEKLKKCNLCGVVLKSISTHLNHVHFPKRYKCTQCDAEYRLRKALEVHLFEHSVGKFLKCPICDREFSEKKFLQVHLKTKKHRDHPLAQNTAWLDEMIPARLPKNYKVQTVSKQQESEDQSAVEGMEAFEEEWNDNN